MAPHMELFFNDAFVIDPRVPKSFRLLCFLWHHHPDGEIFFMANCLRGRLRKGRNLRKKGRP